MPMEGRPECDYSVLVSRAERDGPPGSGRSGSATGCRSSPSPSPPDGDARVDLQEVLHRAYDGPGYEQFIYKGHPDPPLSADDAAWARTLVPKAG